MNILTLYFSGTGNTEFIARLFSGEMNARCFSIEADMDFSALIKSSDMIAFCYPVYGSRVPRIMREFAAKYMSDINGKKIVIFVTQMIFSGDGARVFTDMFWDGAVRVVYAEHFNMPNNIGNILIFRKPSEKSVMSKQRKAEAKMKRVCRDIREGITKKRGFSRFSQMLGSLQGKAWQGDSREITPSATSIESKIKSNVRIHEQCNNCGLCVKICPMKNLLRDGTNVISQAGNCIACYRCVNRCPHRAITVWIHLRPRWQYNFKV